MADQDKLRDLRQHAHEMGIPGSSKMSEDELRQALRKIGKGAEPVTAKREAKGWQ